jgi:hypothetical protein
MDSILDYNNALNAYNSAPSAATYNNVLNLIPAQSSPQTTNSSSNNGGGSSGGSGGTSSNAPASSSDSMSQLQAIISGYQSAQNTYNSKAASYYQNNPFNYDQMLATATSDATSALSPYYTELLGNFMTGINSQSALSLTEQQNAVNQLMADQDVYTGQAKAQLQQAMLQAGQQYSDAGSYDSGVRQRTQGQQAVQTAYGLQGENLSTQYQENQQKLAGEQFRNVQVPLQISNENLELTNQKTQAINSLASQDYGNAVNLYNYNAQKAIGAPPGEDPTQFQNQLATQLPYVSSSVPSTQQG